MVCRAPRDAKWVSDLRWQPPRAPHHRVAPVQRKRTARQKQRRTKKQGDNTRNPRRTRETFSGGPAHSNFKPPVWHSVGLLLLYGALDSHPFFPSHVASGRCVLWVAAFCRPLRPVLLLVALPRSRSPVVGVPPPPPRACPCTEPLGTGWSKVQGAHPSSSSRLLLKGQRPKKKARAPKIGLKLPAPLISSIFCRRNIFLMWGGGGRGWPRPQTTPPPPPPAPVHPSAYPRPSPEEEDAGPATPTPGPGQG